MPEDSAFPEPNKCPKLKDSALNCPRPPEALDDVMEAIEGDNSELSYISASIFAREISELGAIWHGCSWTSHEIIDKNYSSDEFSMDEIDDWDWSEDKPKDWRPSVVRTEDKFIVNFYTYTGLLPEGIVRHTDIFAANSYRFTSDSKMIAESGGGYIY